MKINWFGCHDVMLQWLEYGHHSMFEIGHDLCLGCAVIFHNSGVFNKIDEIAIQIIKITIQNSVK
jgi:hypothetical protein